MKKLLHIGLILSPLLTAFLLLILFNTTDPVTISPTGILAIFLCWYLFWSSLFFVVLHYGVRFFSRFIIAKKKDINKKEVIIGVRKAYYIASVLAFAPVIILAMRSFSQLKWTDLALVGVFIGLMIFYIVKRVE